MVRITLRIKWNGTQKEILHNINQINYFNSIKASPKNVLSKINALNLANQIPNSGSFYDGLSNTVILFLTGSGRVMELIIECFGVRENDIRHIKKQRDKIIGFLCEKKNDKRFSLNKRIYKKILFEELKINYSELVYKNVNKVPILSAFISTIGLFANFLFQFLIFSPFILISFIVFSISFILDFFAIIYYNKMRGNEYAFIP